MVNLVRERECVVSLSILLVYAAYHELSSTWHHRLCSKDCLCSKDRLYLATRSRLNTALLLLLLRLLLSVVVCCCKATAVDQPASASRLECCGGGRATAVGIYCIPPFSQYTPPPPSLNYTLPPPPLCPPNLGLKTRSGRHALIKIWRAKFFILNCAVSNYLLTYVSNRQTFIAKIRLYILRVKNNS